jgi:hypothetical protein
VGRRRSAIIVAAIGVGAAVALVLIGGGPSPTELTSLAAELDGRIRETAAAAQARAQTLAQLPRLSWAVATDEQTMLDLTSDELAFRAAPGELIEIGQVRRRDGAVTSLRRVGDAGVFHLPLADVGAHLVGSDGRLHVVDVVSVEPKTGGDQIRGAVAVSRLVDTGTLDARLSRLGFALRVDVPGGGGIIIGRAPADAHTEGLPLYADAAHGAKLVALVRAGSLPSLGHLAGAGALFLLSLIAALFLWRSGPRPARDEAPLPDLVPEGHEVHIDLRDRR